MSADDLTAAYAEVLAEHAVSAKSPESTACACDRTWRPDREYRSHIAAALVASPATKAHEAAVEACPGCGGFMAAVMKCMGCHTTRRHECPPLSQPDTTELRADETACLVGSTVEAGTRCAHCGTPYQRCTRDVLRAYNDPSRSDGCCDECRDSSGHEVRTLPLIEALLIERHAALLDENTTLRHQLAAVRALLDERDWCSDVGEHVVVADRLRAVLDPS